ncbi:MAG: hypothetical protein R3F53_25170 [Gammaproteobacteria bacterium]
MDTLRKLFLITFFSKSILLTPIPIDIGFKWQEIIFPEPISAIDQRAAFYVDISSVFQDFQEDPLFFLDRKELLLEKIPLSTIEISLFDEEGRAILFKQQSFAFQEDKILVRLNAEEKIKVGEKYIKLKIRSAKDLQNISIIWKNYNL